MATFVVEARVASPGGSWTTVTEVVAFVFRKEVNNLYRAEVTVVNPPGAVEALLVRDNEIRIRDTDVPKEWYRGKIRDATDDPLTKIFNLEVLGVAVVLHDRSWLGRREFPIVPAEVSADELAHSLDGEPRAGQKVYFDMETLTNDSPAKMKDLSSGGNDGIITGTVSVAAKWGLGRNYTAETDKVIITNYNYDGFTAFGHGAHIRIANMFATRTEQIIYGAGVNSTNSQGELRLTGPAGGLPNTIGVLINTATQGFQNITIAFTFVLGQVYHVYATWDGSNVRIYVDGDQKRIQVASGALVSGPTSHAIGHRVDTADTQTFHDFIDNVSSYDRAPSVDEVKLLSGRNILPGHNGTIDSFTAIGFRSEEEKRGVTIETLARAVGAEVFVDQNASDENRFNFVDRIGSASATDTFKFGETAVLASRKVDSESIYNDITVLGYGDGINQLKSRNFHATTIRSTVAIRQTASASTLDIADASSYPSSGIIQAGRERERYTGKTGDQLTGISGANRAYTADGYESLAAYAHEVGIEVFLHADTTTSPATYYTPEVP
ncbi:MAG: LamG-like jellyroll fold domain-containing protein, partial [Thermoplasmata archaeon]